MQTPKLLQNIKSRFLTTGLTAVGTVGLSGYLTTLAQSQSPQSTEATVITLLAGVLMASTPKLLDVILGVTSNIISSDLYDRFTKQEIYKQIPPEANLYSATYTAFQSILNEIIQTEEKRADKKQIRKLRDITYESWLELVSLNEQKDDVSAIARGVLEKFKDKNLIENQFLQTKSESPKDMLSRQDWLILLLRLQDKEETYLISDLEDKVLDALEQNYTTRLRSVFSNHQATFQEITLQLWETLFGKLEDIHSDLAENTKITKSNEEISKDTNREIKEFRQEFRQTQTQAQAIPAITKPKGLINVSRDGKAFFMEQGTVLRDLERQLKSRHIACLHGKHGLGKTTNAQEFARRQAGNYELIVFLSAAEKILETSIIDFADNHIPDLRKLSLLERQQVKPEAKFALFRDFFEDERLWQGEKRGWLLIFDNLESKEQIRRYFPNTNNGDILYTCNDDLYLDERCEVPIHEFSPAEAELFLYKRNDERKNASRADIPPETLADIRKILNDYGGLPFVLNKFRVYLSEIPISYAAFYTELKNNEKRYLELPASNDKYQYKNEIIAYSTSFEKIKPRENQSAHDRITSRLAVTMLNISAFCFADRIPGEILKETLFRLVDTPETTASNETLFFEAFRLLRRFDLLNSKTEIFDYVEKKQTPEIVYLPFKKEETVYQSHRTIQKIVRLNLESEAKKEILDEIISVFRNLIPKSNLENWKIFEKYLSSAENIVEEARKLELATVELGYICNQFGLYQIQLAQYQNAIKFYQEAIEIDEKTIGKEHPDYATRLNNLANVYQSQGRYEEAIELYKQVLEIDEKTIGKEHPDYANGLNNLASVYDSQGRYEEAIQLYQQALEIDEKTLGKEHPDYAIDLNNLAVVYDSQGRYEEAIELYQQALEITEKTIGKEHPDYATRLNNLASVYKSQGRYEEAIELYQQAIEIGKKTLGKEHPDYATRLNNLANIYYSQGRYEEAIELYQQAIEIDEKTIGKEHPDYAIRLNNLASVYDSQGRYEEAIELYKQTLEIGKKTIGKEHPAYATRLNNLASVYDSQGRYEEAIELYKQALEIDEKTIGKEHPDYAIRLNNLALVYKKQGRYEEAIEFYQQAIEIDEKTIGKEHPDYAIRLNNLARVYYSQDRYEEALSLFEESLRIFENTLPENHPYTVRVRENAAECRAMLEK